MSWIAVSLSTQNAGIESAALQRGSSKLSCSSMALANCIQPVPFTFLSTMMLKRNCLLPIKARVISLAYVGKCSGTSSIAPSLALNSSKSTGVPTLFNVTASGGFSLWFSVSGTRSIDAASAVLAGSASKPFSWHNALRRIATGLHCALDTSAVRPQYT